MELGQHTNGSLEHQLLIYLGSFIKQCHDSWCTIPLPTFQLRAPVTNHMVTLPLDLITQTPIKFPWIILPDLPALNPNTLPSSCPDGFNTQHTCLIPVPIHLWVFPIQCPFIMAHLFNPCFPRHLSLTFKPWSLYPTIHAHSGGKLQNFLCRNDSCSRVFIYI